MIIFDIRLGHFENVLLWEKQSVPFKVTREPGDTSIDWGRFSLTSSNLKHPQL